MFGNGLYNPILFPNTTTGIKGLFSKINIKGILNSTSKTLNIINQAIPIYNQVKPMFSNAKTMLKVITAMKEPDSNKINNINTTIHNNESNVQITKNDNGPTFFI